MARMKEANSAPDDEVARHPSRCTQPTWDSEGCRTGSLITMPRHRPFGHNLAERRKLRPITSPTRLFWGRSLLRCRKTIQRVTAMQHAVDKVRTAGHWVL